MTIKTAAKSVEKSLMNEFPPARDKLVTLANWRTQPSSNWSFHNVRQLLPTANIAASKQPVPLESSLTELGQVTFDGNSGAPVTLREALRTTHTKGFVVLHRGRVATEWYAHGMDGRTPHIVFSVSKSICGALGGILADKGFLNPNRPVTDYVPEVSGSVYGGCSVRHLLDMSVGISFTEDYLDPDGDVARYRRAVLHRHPRPMDLHRSHQRACHRPGCGRTGPAGRRQLPGVATRFLSHRGALLLRAALSSTRPRLH